MQHILNGDNRRSGKNAYFVHTRPHGQAHAGRSPYARRRGQSFNRMLPKYNGACTQEADAGNYIGRDAGRIHLEVSSQGDHI
ncbi:hypothetical protein SDC9_188079 [bioreactor metagenome]|uniref:Uncharacterized protein n=1 Tax=bioreactor metagenome TaxID=1076179 RepID=A0A645HNA8_9ZZZZ